MGYETTWYYVHTCITNIFLFVYLGIRSPQNSAAWSWSRTSTFQIRNTANGSKLHWRAKPAIRIEPKLIHGPESTVLILPHLSAVSSYELFLHHILLKMINIKTLNLTNDKYEYKKYKWLICKYLKWCKSVIHLISILFIKYKTPRPFSQHHANA